MNVQWWTTNHLPFVVQFVTTNQRALVIGQLPVGYMNQGVCVCVWVRVCTFTICCEIANHNTNRNIYGG